jgi:nucleoside triphosphate pyrophosphatase
LAEPPRGAARAPLVLASASPQRRAILERLGVAFEVRAPEVPERGHGEPRAVALENARRKARAASRVPAEEVVLGCDTIVCLDGKIYGKPADEAAARETLGALSGKTHEVLSGLVLLIAGSERAAVARTAVTFRALDEALLDWYVATGEWRGRSGAYAIQKAGAALVRAIEGEGENVVGLPVAALLDLYPELLQPRARTYRNLRDLR